MTKYLTILNIIIFQSFILGQTITGSVKDRITNGNLDGVNITIQGTERYLNRFGRCIHFRYIGSFKRSNIKFQHIGYDELTLPLDSLLTGSNIIMLQPRVLQFELLKLQESNKNLRLKKTFRKQSQFYN
ncbi:MAG: hypothetical protein Ct9H300mP18_06950 [Candidatus Neomarinimicrobiota bacterium]|nr:MAG: hypothetical protein Ct9H300mP18_06950 [Candidatus Neomarinimicrobiota bacterium]